MPVVEDGEVSQRGGASFVETRDGYAVYEAGSGDYIFWTPHDP